MTDTLLHFQILIRTSTFKSLKWSIFSVSFFATRISKGQATLTMKHTLHSFSRVTASGLLLLLLVLLLLLESKTGQMKTPNASTKHEEASPGFMWRTNVNLNWLLHKEHWLLGRIKSLHVGQKCMVWHSPTWGLKMIMMMMIQPYEITTSRLHSIKNIKPVYILVNKASKNQLKLFMWQR